MEELQIVTELIQELEAFEADTKIRLDKLYNLKFALEQKEKQDAQLVDSNAGTPGPAN